MGSDSKSSGKIFLILGVVLIVLVGGGFFLRGRLADEAYRTFETLMNKLVGPNNQWEAAAHDFSIFARSLTVNQLKITLKDVIPSPKPTDQSDADDDADADAAKPEPTPKRPRQPLIVTVDQVRIKNGLSLESLNNLLALNDWRSQGEKALAEELELTNIKSKADEATFTTDSLLVTDLKLAAASDKQPAGALGFVKSARLGQLTINKIVLSAITDPIESDPNKIDGTLKIEKFAVVNPILAEGVESLTTPIDFIKLAGFTCQSFQISGVEFDLQDGIKVPDSNDIKMTMKMVMKLEDILETGVEAKGVVEKFSLKNASFHYSEPALKLDARLGSVDFSGFDYSRLLDRFLTAFEPIMNEAFLTGSTPDLNYSQLSELYGSIYTLANLFSLPYDINEALVTDFYVNYNDEFAFGSHKSSLKGPYKAGRLPAKSLSELDFYVHLPKVDKPQDKVIHNLYQFGQDFGQTDFLFTIVSDLESDPKTGVFTIKKHHLAVQDLFSLDIDMGMVGLTEAFVAKLDDIPAKDSFAIMTVPGLYNLGFTELAFNYQDHSLFQKAVGLAAKNDQIPYDQEIEKIRSKLDNEYPKNLTNQEALAKAVNLFLDNPQKVSLGIAPDKPFTINTVQELKLDATAVLNVLKIFLTANNEPPVVLNFKDLPKPTDSDDDDDEDYDELIEEDLLLEEED
ncbi:MAG: hypothetical protein LBS60_14425 [Deltaproteobacteria bacterium]|jgi:hypothetical protein|nr:hypothetical protein [Deltaproteobacteria bacterium]